MFVVENAANNGYCELHVYKLTSLVSDLIAFPKEFNAKLWIFVYSILPTFATTAKSFYKTKELT